MDEEAKKMQEVMKNMKVKDFSLMFIQTLSSLAWQKMGLVPSPDGSEDIDLNEAKLAIDVSSAIFDSVTSSLDENTKNTISTLISNLKINYVEKANK